MPELAAIIVNYNAGDELRRALLSIAAECEGIDWEAVVVDNASTDGSATIVASLSPRVSLISNDVNVGFGRAVNQAVAASTAPLLLLVNPDCQLRPGALPVMRAVLDAEPSCAIVGPRILDPDGSVQGSARGDPDMLTGLFGRTGGLRTRLPLTAVARRNVVVDGAIGSGAASVVVDWVSGACMLIRRAALQIVCGFDERYFLYWEDADVCRRLRLHGQQIRYAPGAIAVHTVGRSSRSARASSIRAFHASAYRYYATHVARGALDPRRPIARAILTARCRLKLRTANAEPNVPAFARSVSARSAVASGGGGNTNGEASTGNRERPVYVPRPLVRRVEFRPPTPLTMATHALASVVLLPAYAVAAAAIRAPGLRFHREAVAVAARLVLNGGPRLLGQAGRLALYPMDSTRYFEFDWTWAALMRLGRVSAYLDVSSPRFFPLCYARRSEVERAVFINPDADDLATTEAWASALALSGKCRFRRQAVETLDPRDGLFDAITSISVFEHIADEQPALTAIRRLLKPGGTALLTLPCAAARYDQYRDYDEYGLGTPDGEGHYFFQRFYDASSLRERVFAVLGEPRRMVVYGEREPGFFGRNAEAKLRGLPYPFWREGYMMGRHFQTFSSIDALPGEGVVALEFVNG